MQNTPIDGSSSLDAVYDGLHGYIALDDVWGEKGQIRRLLGAPCLQRLRHIKQLGFVSQSFLSAEHNRYAHALGTMHMMRALITQLSRHGENPETFWDDVVEDVAKAYRFANCSRDPEVRKNALFQHLLVAALLQDVGEYPYAKATEFFFAPQQSVKSFVQKEFSLDVSGISNKSWMTLAIVLDKSMNEWLGNLNREFLAFLLSGVVREGLGTTPGMKILRHMLDGAIDADRLDYVYRDAYHTLGEVGRATPMIDSLSTYDEKGPVLKHVRPVTEFLAKRALLWSSVYHAPENRFRIILLRTVFKELGAKPEFAEAVFGKSPFDVSTETFLDFDDRWIEGKINDLAKAKKLDLTANAKRAVEFLASRNSELRAKPPEYEYRWVLAKFDGDCDLKKSDRLPNYFYFDLYSDYSRHSLYDKGSVRVQGERYKKSNKKADTGVVALEDCVGPFSAALSSSWSSLPMPGHMAWFQPSDSRHRKGSSWERLQRFQGGAEDPQLCGEFILKDVSLDGEVSFDTRRDKDTVPPDIFISFCWDDYATVYRIVQELKRRRRRYFCLGGNYIGTGATIVENSRQAVREAGAVIILCSESYFSRYEERKADGAIAAEVGEMIRRVAGGLPIMALSLEHYEALENRLNWADLGFEGGKVPAVAQPPLRFGSDDDLRRAVGDAVDQIQRRYDKAKGAGKSGWRKGA